MDMTGHNSGKDLVQQRNRLLSGLDQALKNNRVGRQNDKDQMIIMARYLLALDQVSIDEEDTDQLIKKSLTVLPTDLIAAAHERVYARWLARGGVKTEKSSTFEKDINEINDLSPSGLNGLESALRTRKKFVRVTSFAGVYGGFARECKSEISKVLRSESGLSLDGIRGTYANTLFKPETVEAWISEESAKHTDAYRDHQMLKRAVSIDIERALHDPKHREKMKAIFKESLAELHRQDAADRAEAEARKAAASLPQNQRRIIAETRQRAEESGISKEISDEDF